MLTFLKSFFGVAKHDQINTILSAGAVIIDVRTPGEFTSGHAKGAVNIPLDTLESKISIIKKYNKPIVLCCASGMRSGRAMTLLASKQIPDLHDAGSWKNLP